MKTIIQLAGCLLAAVHLSSIRAMRINQRDLADLGGDVPGDQELVAGVDPSVKVIQEGEDVVRNSDFEGHDVDTIDILAYSSEGADQF